MKKRIVKETSLFGIDRADECTRPKERFVVEVQRIVPSSVTWEDDRPIGGELQWETDIIPIGKNFVDDVPAIFQTFDEAKSYVNHEYGFIGRQVVWEGEA